MTFVRLILIGILMAKIGLYKKGVTGGKSRLPGNVAFCYPNYKQLQKGMSFKYISRIKVKLKKDPRFILPRVPKAGRT